MVTAERDVLPLLGKSMDAVAALHWLPSEHDEYVGEDATIWSYQSLGLELSFGNEDGRLQTIFLHSAGHNDFSGFTPPLPLGIVFENDPADIHALLGEPSVSGGGGGRPSHPGEAGPNVEHLSVRRIRAPRSVLASSGPRGTRHRHAPGHRAAGGHQALTKWITMPALGMHQFRVSLALRVQTATTRIRSCYSVKKRPSRYP